ALLPRETALDSLRGRRDSILPARSRIAALTLSFDGGIIAPFLLDATGPADTASVAPASVPRNMDVSRRVHFPPDTQGWEPLPLPFRDPCSSNPAAPLSWSERRPRSTCFSKPCAAATTVTTTSRR